MWNASLERKMEAVCGGGGENVWFLGELVSFASDVNVQVSFSRDGDSTGHAGQAGLAVFQLELVKLLDPSVFVFETSVETGISKSSTQILFFPRTLFQILRTKQNKNLRQKQNDFFRFRFWLSSCRG